MSIARIKSDDEAKKKYRKGFREKGLFCRLSEFEISVRVVQRCAKSYPKIQDTLHSTE
jgi:hypothetical protein